MTETGLETKHRDNNNNNICLKSNIQTSSVDLSWDGVG